MRTDKTPSLQTMTTRQKVTGAIFVIVLIIIIWQLIGLFRGEGSAATPPASTAKTPSTAPGQMSSQLSKPSPANLKPMPSAPLSQREAELMQLQQQTESKYVAAINELQMLKIQRDIAQTNQEIARARLETVTAQQGIVQLLSPPAPTPATYARGLVNPVTGAPAGPTTQQSAPPIAPVVQTEVSYSVISVSQLQSRWSAVVGYQGNLYNVFVGDVLPPDNSTVVAISKAGVVLQKDGARRKVSLVPII